MTRQIFEKLGGNWRSFLALVAILIASQPVPSFAQYGCTAPSGCFFDCGPGNSTWPNGAIHLCTCSGEAFPNSTQQGSSMGSSCYNIGSHCAPWEPMPMGTQFCHQWACQPGQACTTSNGCSGVCVYTSPSELYSGSPVSCIATPSSATCGNTCCGVDQVCSNGTCQPRCGNSPYDPATQCCVNQEIQSKFEISDLAKCPNRAPRPGWDPNDPSHVNGCGPSGWGGVFPDSYGNADFTPACNTHDACYGTCNSNKDSCDTSFGAALHNACAGAYPDPTSVVRRDCMSRGWKYYSAVHGYGNSAHESAQKESCICCP
jgi:hypothetical protein